MTNLLVAVLVFGLGGVIAHELTHYVVARLYGREPSIDWIRLECLWRAPQEERDKADELISAAPVLVGMFVAALLMPLSDGSVTPLDAALGWGLVLYTLPVPILGIGASRRDWSGLNALIWRGLSKQAG